MIPETTEVREPPSLRGGDYVAGLMAELDRAEISARIRQARTMAGFRNRRDLADVMRVHWRTIEDWENPKHHNVPFDRMEELSRVLKTTKWWLLHGEQPDEVKGLPAFENRLEALEVLVDRIDQQTALGFESLETAIRELVARLPPREQADEH